MKNNKGFISTSIIFAFFITFLLFLVIIITSYAQNRILMNQVKKDIKNNLKIKYKLDVEDIDNIVSAYTYNQDSAAQNYCITGDETTCKETKCYEINTAGSCPSGTIISYQVNDREIVRFHVVHDYGATITMQSQKNTINNFAWYVTTSNYTNRQGPLTILPELEKATNGWNNVNSQTYIMGTTTFPYKQWYENGYMSNEFTGCSGGYMGAKLECETGSNIYTLTARTSKARTITAQELQFLGCTIENSSCPVWIYNYLHDSTSYGGTKNDTTTANGASFNNGYWTITGCSSGPPNYAWGVKYSGSASNIYTYDTNYGARAVVEINRSN